MGKVVKLLNWIDLISLLANSNSGTNLRHSARTKTAAPADHISLDLLELRDSDSANSTPVLVRRGCTSV